MLAAGNCGGGRSDAGKGGADVRRQERASGVRAETAARGDIHGTTETPVAGVAGGRQGGIFADFARRSGAAAGAAGGGGVPDPGSGKTSAASPAGERCEGTGGDGPGRAAARRMGPAGAGAYRGGNRAVRGRRGGRRVAGPAGRGVVEPDRRRTGAGRNPTAAGGDQGASGDRPGVVGG